MNNFISNDNFVQIASAQKTKLDKNTEFKQRRVALVCMPWGSVKRPSLALATLKECVKIAGFVPKVHLLNMEFAVRLGISVYEQIANYSFVPTEWFFAQYLFGADNLAELNNSWENVVNDKSASEFVDHLKQCTGGSEELCRKIANVDVPWFIENCMNQVPWQNYMVVGFTTTFAQSLASLALAKRIKETFPLIKIVLGGANVDSEMGVEFLKGFPWVDYVVHGEAESSFPALLKYIADPNNNTLPPGVSFRNAQLVIAGHEHARPLLDLNESPMPDYSDYLQAAESLGLKKQGDFQLYFEASRGCWWGMKHHCTFCGLNGTTMAFRKKSADRVYTEILHLAERYRSLTLSATDNILAMEYFADLLPRLASQDLDLKMFFEVKANLTKDHLKLLRCAGVDAIQPGIESMSSRILHLMNKGTTALQNIQLLKWCYEYDIVPSWNLLYGFPGEMPEDYVNLPTIFKLLMHLKPPSGLGPVLFERFSPYFYSREDYSISLKPATVYSYLFPQSRVDLEKVAYFFDGEWPGRTDPELYIAPVRDVFKTWEIEWGKRSIYCSYDKGPGYVVIYDNRPINEEPPVKQRRLRLSGQRAEVFLYCDEHRSYRAIQKHMKECSVGQTDIEPIVKDLISNKLMFSDGERYISLPVRRKTILRRHSDVTK